MRFVTVRDLRGRPKHVWQQLSHERELVVTSNGKPVAILSAVAEGAVEESLSAIRRARAMAAVEALQRESVSRGTDRVTAREIESEIAKERKKGRR